MFIPIITVILFSLWCTGGIGWLIWYYHQIEKNFKKKKKIFKNHKGSRLLDRIIYERAKQTEKNTACPAEDLDSVK